MKRTLQPIPLIVVSLLAIIIGLALKGKFDSDWYEFAGFVTGVVGVYLVAVEHIVNWPVGIVNVLIYAWVFFTSRLFADMSLQFFFFALSVHGWIAWARGGTGNEERQITRIPNTGWLGIVVAWVIGTAIYYPVIKHFNGAAPFLDSTLTVGSILAQLLLNYKKLENWILWIALDAIYIYLYISRNLISTAVLYGLLLVLAITGLVGWIRTYRRLEIASGFALMPSVGAFGTAVHGSLSSGPCRSLIVARGVSTGLSHPGQVIGAIESQELSKQLLGSVHAGVIDCLEGDWDFTALEYEGRIYPLQDLVGARVSIEGGRITTESSAANYIGEFQINVGEIPNQIDIKFLNGSAAGQWAFGIFEQRGDLLRFCLGLAGAPRPTEFRTSPGSRHVLEELRRGELRA